MLRGNALAKVDDKGRLKLPSKFRSKLVPHYGKEVYVTSILGDCVHIYPVEVYSKIEQRLQGSFFNPKIAKVQRAFSYYGQSATIDGQGRVLIHPLLRDETGIDGEVCVFGHQDRLMVWDRARIVQEMRDNPVTLGDLGDLSDIGI